MSTICRLWFLLLLLSNKPVDLIEFHAQNNPIIPPLHSATELLHFVTQVNQINVIQPVDFNLNSGVWSLVTTGQFFALKYCCVLLYHCQLWHDNMNSMNCKRRNLDHQLNLQNTSIISAIWNTSITSAIWNTSITSAIWNTSITSAIWNTSITSAIWNTSIISAIWNTSIISAIWNTSIISAIWNTSIISSIGDKTDPISHPPGQVIGCLVRAFWRKKLTALHCPHNNRHPKNVFHVWSMFHPCHNNRLLKWFQPALYFQC